MDALYYNYGTHWDFSEDERVMCIRDIITISQEIQKVALL